MELDVSAISDFLYTEYPEATFNTKKDLFQLLEEHFQYSWSYRQWRYQTESNEEFAELVNEFITKADPKITGNVSSVQVNSIDTDKLLVEMIEHYDKEVKREELSASNTFEVDVNQPIAFICVADQHIGGGKETATDVKSVFEHANLIKDTPNTYMIHDGDLSNNFIGNWAYSIAHNRKFTIEEEVALSKKYIEIVKDKLVAWVSGNHNYWSEKYSGLNTQLELLNSCKANCFFDDDEVYFKIKTPYIETGVMIRHIWNGYSIYNITHGIERNAKFDNPNNASIFIGAHIHRGGVIRDFVLNGQTAHALMCGTYKTIDHYAKQKGFGKSNSTQAVGFVLHPEFGVMPYNNIYALCDYMNMVV